jgi:hypothetical protein
MSNFRLWDVPRCFFKVTKLLTNHATVSTKNLFHSHLYTVEKFAPFSHKILYVLLNCIDNFYQCKSEHQPGTAFVHFFVVTADYFYQRRTPEVNILQSKIRHENDYIFKNLLKRQSHEIFDLHFFNKSMAPRALINTLKYFRILFRFRTEISEFILTCIARSRDSALCNIARSFSNFVSSKTSRYAT